MLSPWSLHSPLCPVQFACLLALGTVFSSPKVLGVVVGEHSIMVVCTAVLTPEQSVFGWVDYPFTFLQIAGHFTFP